MALDLKGNMSDLVNLGGTPLSFYEIQLSGMFQLNKDASILCKSVSLPGIKRNQVDFYWAGVKYPVPRETQETQTIEITFYQDHMDKLRNLFMQWLKSGDMADANELLIHQYNDKLLTRLVKSYKLINVFPTDVSDVKLAYEKASEIGEFTVTLSYSVMEDV